MTPDGDGSAPTPIKQRRSGSGRWERGIESAERDQQAVRLRSQGKTLRMISDALGYGGASKVSAAIQRALDAVPADDVVTLRKLENERLDQLIRKAWRLMNRKYPLLYQGMPVEIEGPDGEPVKLHDVAPVRAALDQLAMLSRDRRKLNGLDVPLQVESAVTTTVRYELPGVDMGKLR